MMFLSEQNKRLSPLEFGQKFVHFDKEIQSFIHVLKAQLECLECYIYNDSEFMMAVDKETYNMLQNILPEDVIDLVKIVFDQVNIANDLYIIKFHDDCKDIYRELSNNLHKIPTISVGEGLVTIWQRLSTQPYQILRQNLLTLDGCKIIEWNQLKNTFIIFLNKNTFSIHRDSFEKDLEDFIDGVFINIYDDYKNTYNIYSNLLNKIDWCVHKVGNTNPNIFMCAKNSNIWHRDGNRYVVDIENL